MLEFFRRYQWYFFLVITVVTVISFSFFGTYNTLGSDNWREQVAFTAVNNEEVTRFEIEDMTTFLGTDTDDRALYGVWGFNFLNDGVIRKDFLQTGLAEELVSAYKNEIDQDLEIRRVKEQKYKTYKHPQAPFISTETVWNYFAPEMSAYFQTLKTADQATHQEAINARVKLFLAEKKLSAPMLRQILRYQESQYNWITHDHNIDQIDLSLYGYHNLEDWFGPRFVRIVAQFIMNSAILAEQKGYQVSRSEVLADLVRNTEISYQQNKNNPNIGVATPQEYFNEQLRRLGMDQTRAINVWEQVMLFRRYFHDVGGSALVDNLVYQKYNDYAKHEIDIDLYQLSTPLRINDYTTLQNFESYLKAIAKPAKDDPLYLPTSFFKAEEVSKKYPELVQKRYLLEISQASKKNLNARVSLKETWGWELDENNWATLKKEFPELAVKKESTRDDRLIALDNLDEITRARVDAFARAAIIDSHPEWIDKALNDAKPQISVIGLRTEGGTTPFEGLTAKSKRIELIKLLDQAPLNEEPTTNSKLNPFSADQQTFYKIKVIERDVKPEILTFADANKDGSLDSVRDRILEKHYIAIRDNNPTTYQNEDKSWKSFESVRNEVADNYFEKVLKALEKSRQATSKEEKDQGTKDQLAALRFYIYLKNAKSKIEKDPSQAEKWVKAKTDQAPSGKLLSQEPLSNQWLIEKSAYVVERGKRDLEINAAEAFDLSEQTWSDLKPSPNGNIAFFQVAKKRANKDKEIAIAEQIQMAQNFLSYEAQRILMRQVLQEIIEKNAISLSYLDVKEEENPVPAEPIENTF